MGEKNAVSNEQKRKNAVEKMWLNYYNNTLLEKGLISKSLHRKMHIMISNRKGTKNKDFCSRLPCAKGDWESARLDAVDSVSCEREKRQTLSQAVRLIPRPMGEALAMENEKNMFL